MDVGAVKNTWAGVCEGTRAKTGTPERFSTPSAWPVERWYTHTGCPARMGDPGTPPGWYTVHSDAGGPSRLCPGTCAQVTVPYGVAVRYEGVGHPRFTTLIMSPFTTAACGEMSMTAAGGVMGVAMTGAPCPAHEDDKLDSICVYGCRIDIWTMEYEGTFSADMVPRGTVGGSYGRR